MICKDVAELKSIVEDSRSRGKTIVFTNGCFDILHVGHVRYLKEAKALGDILIVGLNSDRSVKKIKGDKRPFLHEDERAELVDALQSVDYVILFSESTPEKLMSILKPDIHVKGGDYVAEDLPEYEVMKQLGGRTVVVCNIEGKSTTAFIKKILEMERK